MQIDAKSCYICFQRHCNNATLTNITEIEPEIQQILRTCVPEVKWDATCFLCCICFTELEYIYKFREKCLTAQTIRNESVKVEEMDIATKVEPQDIDETIDSIPENVADENTPQNEFLDDSPSDIATEKHKNKHKCDLCSNSYTCTASLNDHKEQMHGIRMPDDSTPPSTPTKQPRSKSLCFYCGNSVSNFVRHIERKHPQECEVQKILSKPANSKERKRLLTKLRKRGNFVYNQKECPKPVRKSVTENAQFQSCPHCLGFYSARHIHKHERRCPENRQHCRETKLSVTPPRMRKDKVSLIAKQDKLICAFEAWYLKIHGSKHYVISQKTRELAKILIEAREMQPDINDLLQLLQPVHFNILIEATKSIAKYDSKKDVFLFPTFAINIATSLRQCCDAALELAVNDEDAKTKLRHLKSLLETKWKFDKCNQRLVNDKTTVTCCNKVFVPPVNKKRPNVRWTDEQKSLVRTFFKTHIANKKPPKRHECENLIKQNPDVMHNKSWIMIKVYVRNVYVGNIKS